MPAAASATFSRRPRAASERTSRTAAGTSHRPTVERVSQAPPAKAAAAARCAQRPSSRKRSAAYNPPLTKKTSSVSE